MQLTCAGVVAPHVGAWIEIILHKLRWWCYLVAPHVGAWIEIVKKIFCHHEYVVAPHVGAWIEMVIQMMTEIGKKSHLT